MFSAGPGFAFRAGMRYHYILTVEPTMIIVRQSTKRTSVAMGVLVAAFVTMGVYGLARFDSQRGRRTAVVLLAFAGVLAAVGARSITRGTIVASLTAEGLELRSGHFGRWGPIRWDDIDEVFLFRSVGLRMVGLRLVDPAAYIRRTPAWVRWSLWLDHLFAAGADAYLSASAMQASPDDVARLIRIFQGSGAIRARFGRTDLVLEFPADVGLTDVLAKPDA